MEDGADELNGTAAVAKPVGFFFSIGGVARRQCAQHRADNGVASSAGALEALRAQAGASKSTHEPQDVQGDEVSFRWRPSDWIHPSPSQTEYEHVASSHIDTNNRRLSIGMLVTRLVVLFTMADVVQHVHRLPQSQLMLVLLRAVHMSAAVASHWASPCHRR